MTFRYREQSAEDVEKMKQSVAQTGLTLNASKCENIAINFDIVDNIDTFKDFKRIESIDMTLLGALVLKGPAVNFVLQNKVNDLHRAVGHLALLHLHDALVLLRNSLAMPKLLYILWTSPCADNKLLSDFDSTLRQGLTIILNIDLTDDQWIQAYLSIRNGGLGVRSAQMLAPYAFWPWLHLHSHSKMPFYLSNLQTMKMLTYRQHFLPGDYCSIQSSHLSNHVEYRKRGME